MANTIMSKKTIVKQAATVGLSTALSRLLGLYRETLRIDYLGAAGMAAAFLTAFKIPNFLRRILGEGALAASFIPAFVEQLRTGTKRDISSLMTLSFLVFQGLAVLFTLFVLLKTEWILRLTVPGWFVGGPRIDLFGLFPLPSAWFGYGEPIALVAQASSYLKILVAFVLCVTSSALIGGALNAANHFFIASFGSVLMNIFFVGGILLCMAFGLDATYLCFAILAGGIVQLLSHFAVYFYLGFGFAPITAKACAVFKNILQRFLPCMIGMSVTEFNLVVDMSLASYLPVQAIPLLFYAERLRGMPYSIFALAFSTTLLPHFSRISRYAPRRLSFYLLEAAKLICWFTIPTIICMTFLSEHIFLTLFFHPEKFSLPMVREAATILVAYVWGLTFISLNRILIYLYYSLHDTWTPAFISSVAVIVNMALSLMVITRWQATGLAFVSVVATDLLRTVLFLYFLRKKFHFTLYGKQLAQFLARYAAQLVAVFTVFGMVYAGIVRGIEHLGPWWSFILLKKVYFWLWMGPLMAGLFVVLYVTRQTFGVKAYFLE